MLNIKEKIKGWGWALLGFGIFAGLILLSLVFIWGIAKVSAFLYPIFSVSASVAILLFIIIVLPFSLIHKCRPFLVGTSLVLSMVCGATVWMYSFLVILGYLGWFAIFLFLFFHFVAPIAAVGLFFKGEWLNGLSIIIGLLFVYGMRIYSYWLASLCENKKEVLIDTMPNFESVNKAISKFKNICIINLVSALGILAGAIMVAIYFPNLYRESKIFRIFFNLVTIYLTAIWIILLFYLYKVSKFLKLLRNLKVRPSLILIFTIVSAFSWQILCLIPIIVIWKRANSYLKYIAKNQESDVKCGETA